MLERIQKLGARFREKFATEGLFQVLYLSLRKLYRVLKTRLRNFYFYNFTRHYQNLEKPAQFTIVILSQGRAGLTAQEKQKTSLSIKRQYYKNYVVIRPNPGQSETQALNQLPAEQGGGYLVVLREGDRLHRQALWKIAGLIEQQPDLNVIYSDENLVNAGGLSRHRLYKPDWSPELLQSVMYVGNMLVLDRDYLGEMGGFDPEMEGAHYYDLLLKIAARGGKVGHVPEILYHNMEENARITHDFINLPEQSVARRVLERHIRRLHPAAYLDLPLLPETYRVRYPLPGKPLVSILIFTDYTRRNVPGRGEIILAQNCLESLRDKTGYENYQVHIVTRSPLPPAMEASLAGLNYTVELFQHPEGRDRPFNFSERVNFGAGRARGQHLLLLNDDMEIRQKGWLEEMLELSSRPGVGVVGAKLLYADETIQHAGKILGIHGGSAHVFHNHPADFPGYTANAQLVRNYSAVTGACLMSPRKVFDEVGGFDESFAVDFNDTDYCLRVIEKGFRVAYTPYAELFHFEQSSLKRKMPATPERQLFLERWGAKVQRDPFYNPNLSLDSTVFAPLRAEP